MFRSTIRKLFFSALFIGISISFCAIVYAENVVLPFDPVGKYQLECINGDDGLGSISSTATLSKTDRKVAFNGNFYLYAYEGIDCKTKATQFRSEQVLEFTDVSKNVKDVDDALELTTTTQHVYAKPLTRKSAALLAAASFCGRFLWFPNVEQEITGCQTADIPAKGEERYSVARFVIEKIGDTNTEKQFFLGKTTKELDGKTTDRRPNELSDKPFVKVE